MVERDPNLTRGRAALVIFASTVASAFAIVAYREHSRWYGYVLAIGLPGGLIATSLLELSGWSSAYRVRRIRRLIQNSPPNTVSWTRRRGAAYMGFVGVIGLALLLAWLAHSERSAGGGSYAIQFLPAAVVGTIAYFILVIAANTYVLSIRDRHLTVRYRPLPHPFGSVDARVTGGGRVHFAYAWRRGFPEYTLLLSINGPGATRDIKLGMVDSQEEAHLLCKRISELMTQDQQAHPV